VPYFDGVEQATLAVDRQAHAALHAEIAAARQLQRGRGIARQAFEEAREQVVVVLEVGGKLPQHGPEFLPQLEHAGREEIGQRRVDVAQPPHVRDEARRLHREHEAARRCIAPARVTFRPLQRIKRTIQFDAGEVPRRVGEFIALHQALRIEHATPRRVTPPRNADADPGHARHYRRAGVSAG
jgi:hypothetical protein